MDIERRHVDFLLGILNFLDADHRRRIDFLLDERILDLAMCDVMRRGSCPIWFAEAFSYDPLYGILDGLRECLARAVPDGLVRLDGTAFRYHLDACPERELVDLLDGMPLDEREARLIARELDQRLAFHESLRT